VKSKTGRELPPLTAEGVVGAVFSVIHARMLERPHAGTPMAGGRQAESRLLVELVNPLMAMIVQPYLGGAAAQRELDRPVTMPERITPRLPADPFKGLSMRLTYRTARVLSSIAASPGSSSKQIAAAAGISDEGQASKLLRRLKRYGLVEDSRIGPAKGLPRAWSLTERGEGVLEAVGER
jgi:DNA-binding MarR family transcriptional regulator